MSTPSPTSGRWLPLRKVAGLLAALLAVALLAAFAAAPDGVRLRRGSEKRPKDLPTATFFHSAHGTLQCYGCHPGIFTSPRPRVTHKEMKQGRYCGACHNGRSAVDVKKLECRSCHVR